MKTQINVFPFKHVIVMNAAGALDLDASKAALNSLVASPGVEASSEVFLDFRDVECEMSTTNIFELAASMALPGVARPATKRIAVLVDAHRHGHLPFNKTQFLELCADSNGLDARVFADYKSADEWLNPKMPVSASHVAASPGPIPPMPGCLPGVSPA